MPTLTLPLERELQPQLAASLYFSLADGNIGATEMNNAADFLMQQLAKAQQLDCDLPDEISGLDAWMLGGVEEVGRQYKAYLEARKAGQPRRYFSNKSHALHFLKSVAPTKLVDGAWLYGLLEHWQDARFSSLIQTYLEELGEGQPSKNHVVLYRKLLASQGNPRWDDLDDDHYIQGAIQLSLAHQAEQFLPEIIGFNLGYEQLPLHLLISAYELKELGIDPYYFTLHITVDNADSGHAKAAVQAVFDAMPKTGNLEAWYRRIQNGYMLNFLGANTNSIIHSFDLDRELKTIFARKSVVGQHAHSNYRQIEGKTINSWLSDSDQMTDFIEAMDRKGWFNRHHDPRESRFWKMIQSETAKMYGVFSVYEQQVIYDWIAGEFKGKFPFDAKIATLSHPISNEEKQRLLHADDGEGSTPFAGDEGDFDVEARALEENLMATTSKENTMAHLIDLMSPDKHHSAPGLAATRIFHTILN